MDKPSPAVLQALIYFWIKYGVLHEGFDLDHAIDHAAERVNELGVTTEEFAVSFARLIYRKLGLPPP